MRPILVDDNFHAIHRADISTGCTRYLENRKHAEQESWNTESTALLWTRFLDNRDHAVQDVDLEEVSLVLLMSYGIRLVNVNDLRVGFDYVEMEKFEPRILSRVWLIISSQVFIGIFRENSESARGKAKVLIAFDLIISSTLFDLVSPWKYDASCCHSFPNTSSDARITSKIS